MAALVIKRRLYVGGLAETITEDELKERFARFVNVSNLTLKARKDDEGHHLKSFAHFDIHGTEESIKKCFSAYQNTKWKGSVMTLQEAKESFLERLQKEREESKHTDVETDSRKEKQSGTEWKPPEFENIKGAPVPGTPVPGKKDWVVGKYGRILPIMTVKKSYKLKAMKHDPSKFCHASKVFKEEADDGKAAASECQSLTWEIDTPDSEITKKRKGQLPQTSPKKKPKPFPAHLLSNSDSGDNSKDGGLEVVKIGIDSSSKAKSDVRSRFDSDYESDLDEPTTRFNEKLDSSPAVSGKTNKSKTFNSAGKGKSKTDNSILSPISLNKPQSSLYMSCNSNAATLVNNLSKSLSLTKKALEKKKDAKTNVQSNPEVSVSSKRKREDSESDTVDSSRKKKKKIQDSQKVSSPKQEKSKGKKEEGIPPFRGIGMLVSGGLNVLKSKDKTKAKFPETEKFNECSEESSDDHEESDSDSDDSIGDDENGMKNEKDDSEDEASNNESSSDDSEAEKDSDIIGKKTLRKESNKDSFAEESDSSSEDDTDNEKDTKNISKDLNNDSEEDSDDEEEEVIAEKRVKKQLIKLPKRSKDEESDESSEDDDTDDEVKSRQKQADKHFIKAKSEDDSDEDHKKVKVEKNRKKGLKKLPAKGKEEKSEVSSEADDSSDQEEDCGNAHENKKTSSMKRDSNVEGKSVQASSIHKPVSNLSAPNFPPHRLSSQVKANTASKPPVVSSSASTTYLSEFAAELPEEQFQYKDSSDRDSDSYDSDLASNDFRLVAEKLAKKAGQCKKQQPGNRDERKMKTGLAEKSISQDLKPTKTEPKKGRPQPVVDDKFSNVQSKLLSLADKSDEDSVFGKERKGFGKMASKEDVMSENTPNTTKTEYGHNGLANAQQRLLSIANGEIGAEGKSAPSAPEKSSPQKEGLTKQELANAKRLQAIKEQVQMQQRKRDWMKSDLKKAEKVSTKRIVFSSSEDEEDSKQQSVERVSNSKKCDEQKAADVDMQISKQKASSINILGDSSDDDEEDAGEMFKSKPQFEGKKGEKLMQLQKRFGDRFKLDKNFIDSDESEEEDNTHEEQDQEENLWPDNPETSLSREAEQKRNLAVLETVVGKQKVDKLTAKLKRDQIKMVDMNQLRFDPTKVKKVEKIEPSPKKDKSTMRSNEETAKLSVESKKTSEEASPEDTNPTPVPDVAKSRVTMSSSLVDMLRVKSSKEGSGSGEDKDAQSFSLSNMFSAEKDEEMEIEMEKSTLEFKPAIKAPLTIGKDIAKNEDRRKSVRDDDDDSDSDYDGSDDGNDDNIADNDGDADVNKDTKDVDADLRISPEEIDPVKRREMILENAGRTDIRFTKEEWLERFSQIRHDLLLTCKQRFRDARKKKKLDEEQTRKKAMLGRMGKRQWGRKK